MHATLDDLLDEARRRSAAAPAEGCRFCRRVLRVPGAAGERGANTRRSGCGCSRWRRTVRSPSPRRAGRRACRCRPRCGARRGHHRRDRRRVGAPRRAAGARRAAGGAAGGGGVLKECEFDKQHAHRNTFSKQFRSIVSHSSLLHFPNVERAERRIPPARSPAGSRATRGWASRSRRASRRPPGTQQGTAGGGRPSVDGRPPPGAEQVLDRDLRLDGVARLPPLLAHRDPLLKLVAQRARRLQVARRTSPSLRPWATSFSGSFCSAAGSPPAASADSFASWSSPVIRWTRASPSSAHATSGCSLPSSSTPTPSRARTPSPPSEAAAPSRPAVGGWPWASATAVAISSASVPIETCDCARRPWMPALFLLSSSTFWRSLSDISNCSCAVGKRRSSFSSSER